MLSLEHVQWVVFQIMSWDQNDLIMILGLLFSNLRFITRKSQTQPVKAGGWPLEH